MNVLELPSSDIDTVLVHLELEITLNIRFVIILSSARLLIFFPLNIKSMLTNLLRAGHRMGEHQVQCGIVFHQRMVLIVPNELHYRSECEWVREAVLPVMMVNLDQLVVPVFPEKELRQSTKLDYEWKTKC